MVLILWNLKELERIEGGLEESSSFHQFQEEAWAMNNQCVFCCCISTLFCLWMIWTQKQITLEPEVDLVPLEDDGTVFSADLKSRS